MSHTSSTYTFTTCRILHPSDQLTSVSPSSAITSCQSSAHTGTPTPIATPSYTPCCTPRRLSLSLSLAESSTNLRDSTKTTSTSLGLVHLLLEHGISASIYNPRSWDRGADAAPVGSAQGTQKNADTHAEADDKQIARQADALLRPSTPPNSPMHHTRSKSFSSPSSSPVFQFSPDDPPYYDTFLASKPARTILREVRGEAERERGAQTDNDSQSEVLNLQLVDKLKRFRTLSPLGSSVSSRNTLLAPFSSSGLGNSALGGGLPVLNAGLRRNRSYPAMVGASMAMKDPGGPHNTEILIPHTLPHTQHTTCIQDVGKSHKNHTLLTQDIHIPQEMVIPQIISPKQTRPSATLCHTSNDHRHNPCTYNDNEIRT